MNEFENVINKLKINIEGIIIKLKNILENMNIIYNINNNILKRYENKNRNYKLLLNFNYMNKYIENEINDIKNKYNYGYNINQLVNIEDIKIIENKILNNNTNQYNNINGEIIYKPNKEGKVRLFGNYFVNNNKEKCKIIYNNKEYELKEYFNDIDKEYNNKNEIKIKLKGINNVTNMGTMFLGCDTLSSLSNISNWDTSKVTDMHSMFSGCKILSSLPDISNWDTSKVTDMTCMFRNCNNLSSLPDISKWNISKVTNMNCMFSGCDKLLNIPSKFKS